MGRVSHLNNECEAGPSGICGSRPMWALRREGDNGTFSYACGRHLNFVASELSGGERGKFQLHRVLSDEK